MNEENTTQNEETQGEETLFGDLRNIVQGVATLTLIVVPFLLIRKLYKTIEESDRFQNLERKLS